MIKKILEHKHSVFYAGVISVFMELVILLYGLYNPDQIKILFTIFLAAMFLPVVILIFHKTKSIAAPYWW